MKTKIIIIVVLAILLIVFVLQNTTMVSIKFWFWELNIPRALLLFVCFAMGLIIGLIIPTSKNKKQPAEPNGN
jgi:putative membrane protein